MTYSAFLERVIDLGIEAARRDYSHPRNKDKLEGSIAGFETCRGKNLQELKELLEVAKVAADNARRVQHERYWWYRCYEAEVEWVCNVVSASLMNQGLPTIITPTAWGVLTAAQILGVKAG